ncbi:OLC1v1037697C1 [Oldenlandia corymbosa var. corymbosa]|uniref:OLC1v1037697C1 n=1 Tax=Oldenlandia corymbosa var. corymbosa TaxID=529605 RepID=A0AAV1CY40_OLDCO|nr:OLC1v1037697C1 [Oldenlandia corymbosa var. corymbosa]
MYSSDLVPTDHHHHHQPNSSFLADLLNVLCGFPILMPGTIQVSVMDFCPPPASTPPTLLTVSLGKREFQTSDKGEFSFPLINLRDNLVVKILDDEGNETAQKGIQTMSIVQKVSWDETFFFEGGGFVHLKLQFVLTEEDRTRIRLKREAALKKKQGNVSKISDNSDITHSDGDSATSLVQAEGKKSGSPDNVTSPASLLPNADISPPDPQSNYGREGATVKDKNSKSTDEREGAFSFPMIQRRVVQHSSAEQNFKKLETESSRRNVHPDRVKEDSSRLVQSGTYVAQTNSLICPGKDDDRDDKLKQEVPLERSPSNVRNLVRAFESSQAKQDSKSSVKVEADRSGTKNVGKHGYPKDYYPKNFSESEGRQKDAFVAGDLRPTLESSSERGEGTDSAKRFIDNIASEMRKTQKKLISVPILSVENESTSGLSTGSPKQLERLSPTEKPTVSGRMNADPYEGDYSPSLSIEKHYSGGTLLAEGRGRTDSTKIGIPVASIEKSKSLECYEEEHFYSQHSGLWIFPNNVEPLCVTAAGKWVRNLLGSGPPDTKFQQKKKSSSSSREGVHQKKSSSLSREREEEFKPHESEHEMQNHPEESQSSSSSRSERSPDNTSGRLFGQVIKIAIIVGFGVLVFVTRQRDPRKSKRDRDELLLATSEFINEQSTIEE